jgi:hypothetical protein
MKRRVVAVFLIILAPVVCRAQTFAEGAVFFDRGHYWIELAFRDPVGRDTIPSDHACSRFEIEKLGEISERFKPSKVEVVTGGDKGPVLVLSSGRLEGRSCYKVTYRPADAEPLVVDSLCDPFYAVPGALECLSKAFFKNYIAAAFRRDGDTCDMNQFKYEYDFSDEKSSASLVIEPLFKTHGFAIEPLFEQSTVAYSFRTSRTISTDKRALGLGVSKSVWAWGLRLSVAAKYRHDRSALGFAEGDSVVFAQCVSAEGRIRFDNLFDSVNRYCLSVFKGVDLGLGCAWYQSDDRDIWGSSSFERTTPFLNLRATWTFLYGFQLSYSLQSFWPASLGDKPTEFHSVRFRLLLRDALPAQEGKSYHPDVELAYDTGERLPLFAKEEKVSIGFTFRLYPW